MDVVGTHAFFSSRRIDKKIQAHSGSYTMMDDLQHVGTSI